MPTCARAELSGIRDARSISCTFTLLLRGIQPSRATVSATTCATNGYSLAASWKISEALQSLTTRHRSPVLIDAKTLRWGKFSETNHRALNSDPNPCRRASKKFVPLGESEASMARRCGNEPSEMLVGAVKLQQGRRAPLCLASFTEKPWRTKPLLLKLQEAVGLPCHTWLPAQLPTGRELMRPPDGWPEASACESPCWTSKRHWH